MVQGSGVVGKNRPGLGLSIAARLEVTLIYTDPTAFVE